ncbi:MAG: major facilitator superfamily protein [Acidimicrobiaceae bacterium]|nr:MAG: major facilitator superfamily protein [Acidimicrobiaceae bacterium]
MRVLSRDDRPVPTPRSPVPGYMVAFVLLGMGLSIVGPALGHLRGRAGVGIGASGLLIGGQSLGYIVGSLIAGRFYDHGHGHRVMVRAGVIGVAAVTAVSGLHQLWALVVVFMIIGLVMAMVDVGGNTLVVWSQTPERVGSSLNALHLCFGIGALVTPLVVAASIAMTGGLMLVALVAAVVLVPMAWRLQRTEVPTQRTAAHGELRGADSDRALVLVCVFFFVYVGAEATFAGWLHTYAAETGLGADGTASLLVSVFWAGFVLGRIIAVWLARVLASSTLLVASCLAATLGAAALGFGDGSAAVVWPTTALVGMLLGPQFATMMAYGDERLRLSGASTARIVASSGAGGLVLPVAVGLLLDRHGAGALPWMATAASGATLVMALAVIRVGRHRPPVTSMNAPVT